jgi:hypothetical protein
MAEPVPDLANFRPLLDRMAQGLWPVLRRSVTPIAAVVAMNRTIPWGTGTFLRIADNSFLVTASHVWQQAVKFGFERQLHVFDFDGDTGLRPVPLTGTIHRIDDPVDVAVVELDSKGVSELSGRQFLRLTDISLQPNRGKGNWCWVYGFPFDSSEHTPELSLLEFNPFFMLAPLCQRDVGEGLYDPNFHFLLDASCVCHRDGIPATIPNSLRGISGCSIWQASWPEANRPDAWDPNSIRIVGVQTEHWSNDSVIKATHWGAVAILLSKARDDLRSAIEITLGPVC